MIKSDQSSVQLSLRNHKEWTYLEAKKSLSCLLHLPVHCRNCSREGEETHGFTGSLIQKAIASKPFCCFDACLAEALPICSSQHVANSLAKSWSDNRVNPELGLLIPAEKHCSFTRQTWTDLTGTHSTRSNSFRSFWWLDTTYWQVTDWIISVCAAPQPGHGYHEARVRAWGWQKPYAVLAGWSSSGVLEEQCRDLFLLMRGDGLLKRAALSLMSVRRTAPGWVPCAWQARCSTQGSPRPLGTVPSPTVTVSGSPKCLISASTGAQKR